MIILEFIKNETEKDIENLLIIKEYIKDTPNDYILGGKIRKLLKKDEI